jgi:malate dehydrogenase (oxaloacetate-decarboxylating)
MSVDGRAELRGDPLADPLADPLRNRGLAFTAAERAALGVRGRLPPAVRTLEEQIRWAIERLRERRDDLDRYVELAALQDDNETLFFRVLSEHLAELLPVVYTPTVGLACQRYSRLPPRRRGLWITPDDSDCLPQLLRNSRQPDVRLIVVTDNERILGLGDLGAGGMGIPIGKLALYCVAAGVRPEHCLPISLDVGTNNRQLLDDPLYIGRRAPRLRGAPYFQLLDKFVAAVRATFPRCLIQWEDFHKDNAFAVRDRYQAVTPSFNDDIQGTAAVALAGLLTAMRVTGEPWERQRIVYAGAGGAGVGIGRLVRAAMRQAGVDGDALRAAQLFVDSQGLVHAGRQFRESHKRDFAVSAADMARYGLDGASRLLDVVRAVRPTVLIGTTTQRGAFDEPIVRAMAEHCPRPVIMALSNPTAQCEVVPEDALRWSGGRALVATGSAFPPLEFAGRRHVFGQANNVFIFPGVGFACLLANVQRVDDGLFLAAARELAECVTGDRLGEHALYPPVAELRAVSARVAAAVVREAVRTGAGVLPDARLPEQLVAESMWSPA